MMNEWIAELIMMLTPRGDGTATEDTWINQWIKTIPGITEDKYGNFWLDVGETNGVMFTCHTDTVHHSEYVPLILVEEDGYIRSYRNGKRAILGGDDTCGAWLMRRMISHGVPGTYAFFRSEESGGRGSHWAAGETAKSLGDSPFPYSVVVSLDRKGTDDIITYQSGRRCCSEEFAKALALALNTADAGFKYEPDETGSFTDSASYMTYVPECTNISVGYYSQHSVNEEINLNHLLRLADALCKVDWAGLPIKRDPSVIESRFANYTPYVGGTRSYGTYGATPVYHYRPVQEWILEAFRRTNISDIVALIKESEWAAAAAIAWMMEKLDGLEPPVVSGTSGPPPKDGGLEDAKGLVLEGATVHSDPEWTSAVVGGEDSGPVPRALIGPPGEKVYGPPYGYYDDEGGQYL